MLQIQGISKSYGKQNVLRNFSFDIQSGEIISVVGSSGSGKTTLLRLISGLELPDDGQITLKHEIVSSNNNFVRPEDRDCSLVFQDYALFPNMSMRQNIYFGKNSQNNKEKIEQLIEITNIESILEKFPHQCSGGEQQRVALVRSLAINPSLVLMDEPLSNLDQSLKANLALVIRNLLKKFKITAVIVTHDIIDAMEMSDRLIVIDKGEVMQNGICNELYSNPQSKKIALLFGDTNFIPLKMFPDSKNNFFDTDTNKDLISIRPNQFSLYDEDLASGKKVFVGKIESIREVASEHKIKLECKDLSLKVSLSSQIELSIGQEIKLMAP